MSPHPPDRPDRLWAVVALNTEALDEPAQRALRALAALPAQPNSFSQEAALAITDQTVEVLEELVEAGLLEVQGKRYILHQAIADYVRWH